jgi:hypothetical protein
MVLHLSLKAQEDVDDLDQPTATQRLCLMRSLAHKMIDILPPDASMALILPSAEVRIVRHFHLTTLNTDMVSDTDVAKLQKLVKAGTSTEYVVLRAW